MKPSIWTSFLARFDPLEALNIFAESGFRYLELSTEHMVMLTDGKDRFRMLDAFGDALHKKGIRIGQCHAPILSTIVSKKTSFRNRIVDLVDCVFPYSGTMEWEPIVKSFKDIKYRGLFNLEVPGETKRCPPGLLKPKTVFVLNLLNFMLKQN